MRLSTMALTKREWGAVGDVWTESQECEDVWGNRNKPWAWWSLKGTRVALGAHAWLVTWPYSLDTPRNSDFCILTSVFPKEAGSMG
jgi:hypothetical protein